MSNYYLVNVTNAKAIHAEHEHCFTEKHSRFDTKTQEFIKTSGYSFLCENLETEWFAYNKYLGKKGVSLQFKPPSKTQPFFKTQSIFVWIGEDNEDAEIETIRLTKKQG